MGGGGMGECGSWWETELPGSSPVESPDAVTFRENAFRSLVSHIPVIQAMVAVCHRSKLIDETCLAIHPR